MKIDYPAEQQLPQLRALWREAFADEDAFVDAFFGTAFASDRCRCISEHGQITAKLYCLDCKLDEKPLAYLYAIATAKKYQNQGLCKMLMANTREHLTALGYAGALLVPGDEDLARMYRAMGFTTCTYVREFSCKAGNLPATLRKLTAAQYAQLRKAYLPQGGILQEGENLAFLEAISGLYAGEDFLYAENAELLGNADAAPGILAALGKDRGNFRTPGKDKPFAMFLPLSLMEMPKYFGLAFD